MSGSVGFRRSYDSMSAAADRIPLRAGQLFEAFHESQSLIQRFELDLY